MKKIKLNQPVRFPAGKHLSVDDKDAAALEESGRATVIKEKKSQVPERTADRSPGEVR